MADRYQLSRLIPFTKHHGIKANAASYYFLLDEWTGNAPYEEASLNAMLSLYVQQYYGLDCRSQARVVDDVEKTTILVYIEKEKAEIYHAMIVDDAGRFELKSTGKFVFEGLEALCEAHKSGNLYEGKRMAQVMKNIEAADVQLIEKLHLSASRAGSLLQ